MIGITVLNWTVNLTSVIIQSDYNLIRINQVIQQQDIYLCASMSTGSCAC